MNARIDITALIVVTIIVLILVGSYRYFSRTAPARPVVEKDVWDKQGSKSLWYTDSRAYNSGTCTEISIIRVDLETRNILERRQLEVIDNRDAHYSRELDVAMDRAKEAMRVANYNLNSR